MHLKCVSEGCDIPLLVPQVRSLLGMGFPPSSQINNHFVTLTFFYVAHTQYVDFVPMEFLQQSKWRCDVHELQVNMHHTDSGETPITIW